LKNVEETFRKNLRHWLTPTIPATQETKIRRIEVQATPDKKLVRPHRNQQAGLISIIQEVRGKRIAAKASQDKKKKIKTLLEK
jgi:hypothetical protein